MQLLTAGKKPVSALQFAPDGLALAASCMRSAPQLWTLPAVDPPATLGESPRRHSHAFTFTSGANVIGWITANRRIEYDRRTGETRNAALVPKDEVSGAQAVCGPDGRLIVRTSQRHAGYRVRAFVPDGADGWTEVWVIGPNEAGGWRLAGCRADRFFLWELRRENRNGALVLRSALTGELLADIEAPIDFALGFSAAPDAAALAFFRDSSLYCWRPGEKVQKVRTGTLKHYRSACFHPDGRHLLAGNNDATARLIDTYSWQVVKQFTWNVGELSAVAISPDGALAAAGGARGRVVVWDLDL